MPAHDFIAFIQENEEIGADMQQEQQQQAAANGDVNMGDAVVAETPSGEHLIVGGQQQEVVIPDSTGVMWHLLTAA